MDDVVCLECGGATEGHRTTLGLPSGSITRQWRECLACGWESSYSDDVTGRTDDVTA